MASPMLERLRDANPVREEEVRRLVPQQWSDELLSTITYGERAERPAATGRATPVRLLAAALLVLAVLALPTYALGRGLLDGWLSGEPAPQSVRDNFDSYTPQLGFQPDAGEAVLVAADRGASLFATTNDRGSYCLATATRDGGTCIPPDHAVAPLIAGIMSNDPAHGGNRFLLVAGRAADPRVRTIRFSDPTGGVVERPVGSSGFFLAALSPTEAPRPCSHGDWRPAFEGLALDGEVVVRAVISLAEARENSVCVWGGPHPPTS